MRVRSRDTKERVRVFVVMIISRAEEGEGDEKCVHSACGCVSTCQVRNRDVSLKKFLVPNKWSFLHSNGCTVNYIIAFNAQLYKILVT